MATHADPPKTAAAKPSAKAVAKDDLQKLPLAEVEKRLSSSPDGLSEVEAKKRLAQYGPNEIAERKTNALLKFLGYFWGPIPWMIEAAVILSAAARHWPDFGIILVLLLANAVVGFWEEHEAGNAIAALKATLAIKARVRRDGKWVTPAARELVPGDVIRVRLGDIVPADARLLDGPSFEIYGFVIKREVPAQSEIAGRGQDSFVRNPGAVRARTQLQARMRLHGDSARAGSGLALGLDNRASGARDRVYGVRDRDSSRGAFAVAGRQIATDP
jgi:hypothetical protein